MCPMFQFDSELAAGNRPHRPHFQLELRLQVRISLGAHRRARLVANLLNEDLGEYLSKAADERSTPRLKNHSVKLPEAVMPVSQAA